MSDFELVLKQLLETVARRLVSFLRGGTEETAAAVRSPADTGREAYQRSGRRGQWLPWGQFLVGVAAVVLTSWGVHVALQGLQIAKDIGRDTSKIAGDPGPCEYVVHFTPVVEDMVREGKYKTKEWLKRNRNRKELTKRLVLEKKGVFVNINDDGTVNIESLTNTLPEDPFTLIAGEMGICLGMVFTRIKANYVGWLRKYPEYVRPLLLTVRYKDGGRKNITIPKEELMKIINKDNGDGGGSKEGSDNSKEISVRESKYGILFSITELIKKRLENSVYPAREISFETQ